MISKCRFIWLLLVDREVRVLAREGRLLLGASEDDRQSTRTNHAMPLNPLRDKGLSPFRDAAGASSAHPNRAVASDTTAVVVDASSHGIELQWGTT